MYMLPKHIYICTHACTPVCTNLWKCGNCTQHYGWMLRLVEAIMCYVGDWTFWVALTHTWNISGEHCMRTLCRVPAVPIPMMDSWFSELTADTIRSSVATCSRLVYSTRAKHLQQIDQENIRELMYIIPLAHTYVDTVLHVQNIRKTHMYIYMLLNINMPVVPARHTKHVHVHTYLMCKLCHNCWPSSEPAGWLWSLLLRSSG